MFPTKVPGFHPSLGIPLITTFAAALAGGQRPVSFHPSLGIPLITTRAGPPAGGPHHPRFHPSLGIPLITTPLQSLRQKIFIPPNLNYKNSTIKCLLLKSTA